MDGNDNGNNHGDMNMNLISSLSSEMDSAGGSGTLKEIVDSTKKTRRLLIRINEIEEEFGSVL